MFDDLAAFFHENVADAFTGYVQIREDETYGRSRDLRAALVAATALYHLREHIPQQYKKTRSEIAQLCPDYDLLGDVVNAAKHCDLTQGNPQINSAENVFETTVVTQYEDKSGQYSDVQKLVIVKLKSGSERDLFKLLTNVINCWGQELVKYGVMKDFKPFAAPEGPGSRFLTRVEVKKLNLEAIRGVRFRNVMRLQKYDPTKGRSEPIDLTGAKVQFRIYKPVSSVDVLLRNEAGEEVKSTFELTEDESTRWHRLETDEERSAFMKALAEDRKDELEKLIADTVVKAETKYIASSKVVPPPAAGSAMDIE